MSACGKFLFNTILGNFFLYSIKSLNRRLDLKSGDRQTDRQTDRMNDRMTTKVLKTRPRVGAASPMNIPLTKCKLQTQ